VTFAWGVALQYKLLQSNILGLELLEPPNVVRLEPAEPLAPRVDRLFADPWLECLMS
jgi:hypothetical protein